MINKTKSMISGFLNGIQKDIKEKERLIEKAQREKDYNNQEGHEWSSNRFTMIKRGWINC